MRGKSIDTIKIGLIGVGAVGGYFGGKLANAGVDVTFLARGKTFDILKGHGLEIHDPTKTLKINNLKVTDQVTDLRNVQIILLCTKIYDSVNVAESLKQTGITDKIIIPMQNGIENREILAPFLGKENIIGTVVRFLGEMTEPGIIHHQAIEKLVIGEFEGLVTERLEDIKNIITKGEINISISEDIKAEIWTKFMLNVIQNGMTALIEGPLIHYQKVSELHACVEKMTREIQYIGKLEGIIIPDEEIQWLLSYTLTDRFAGSISSTLNDVKVWKKTEIEYLNGALIRLSKKHNTSIPLNEFLYGLLKVKYFDLL